MAIDPLGAWNTLKVDPAELQRQKTDFDADAYIRAEYGTNVDFQPDMLAAIRGNWADASGKLAYSGKSKEVLAGLGKYSRIETDPSGNGVYYLYRDDPKNTSKYKMAVAPYKMDDASNTLYRVGSWTPYSQPTKGKAALQGAVPIATILLNAVAPGAGAAIGSALGLSGTAASVASQAIMSGGMSALGGARGSDLLRATAAGAVGGALPAVPGFTSLDKTWQQAITGGVKSGISSGFNPKAVLSGAVGGGLSGVGGANPLSSFAANLIKQQLLRALLGGRKG